MSHVSSKIYFLFEGDEDVEFTRYQSEGQQKPKAEETKMKVIGVQFEYACCGEQCFGIVPMARAFDTSPGGVIFNIPNELKLEVQDNVTILKFGTMSVDLRMLYETKEAGVIGYWDDCNFILCASEEYSHLLKNVKKMIQPKRAKFAFRKVFGGRNFIILAV